jgi:hypothetical protein
VRSSSAAALAEAVEHWPQSIAEAVSNLQESYREKVFAPMSFQCFSHYLSLLGKDIST